MKTFRNIALALVAIVAPLAAAQAAYSNDGYDRTLRVYNYSDYDVYHIYYAPEGASTYYTRDLLASDVLDANYNIRVRIDDGSGRCNFWVRAVTRSGQTSWQRLINVCTSSSWSLTNG